MSVYEEVQKERLYQQARYGNDADDEKNTPNDFVAYISHHATRWFNGGFAPYSKGTIADFRKQMIKVAALAIAAVESIDRQSAVYPNRPFYQVA